MMLFTRFIIPLVAVCFCATALLAQPVTGVWRGKVTRGNGLFKQSYRLEVKLVKNGDSINGTSYYYNSPNNYFRYSVRGYFGAQDNSINWWDDQLIESKSPNVKLGSANNQPMLSTADYNCPGSGVMLLDGNTHPKEGGYAYDIHLQKFENPDFKDEWDPIIDTYFAGGADPYLIDSVSKIAFNKPAPPPAAEPTPAKETTVYQPAKEQPGPVVKSKPEVPKPFEVPAKETTVYQPSKTKPATEEPKTAATTPTEKEPELVENPWKKTAEEKPASPVVVAKQEPPAKPVVIAETKPAAPTASAPQAVPLPEPVATKAPSTMEDKFAQRKNILTTTIPIVGDSMEFKFYDNAEVDGDSISIFLNGKMLYTHIRLTDKGYSVKVPVSDLGTENDLVMVAENLGSIPPNTAYMEVWSGGKRYSARLESTENSSALIRLKRE